MDYLPKTNPMPGGDHLRRILAVLLISQLILSPVSSFLPIAQAEFEGEVGLPQLPLPFSGSYPITQEFGEESDSPELASASAKLKTHNGVDFALPEGTEVLAVDSGKVQISGEGDFGITVAIDHPWGRSVYGHLKETLVAVGDQVEKGQKIALSGSTGISTDPHLHFGIKSTKAIAQRELFGFIDPKPYLPIQEDVEVLSASVSPVDPLSPFVDSEPSAQLNQAQYSGEAKLDEDSIQINEPLTVVLDKDTGPVMAEVKTEDGEVLPTSTQVLQKDGQKVLEITPVEEIETGKYEVKVQSGEEVLLEDDFSWGVLAINSDKTVYLPGETAKFQLAVLDEQGLMVCDAKVSLKIKNSHAEVIEEFTTDSGEIRVNEECKIHEYTTKPDYETSYQVGSTGVYDLELTAQTQNGTHTVTDSFEVRNSVPYEVTRESATRIFPIRDYPTKFTVKFNQDFQGEIKEFLPNDFEIMTLEEGLGWSQITEERGKKVISWTVSAKKGEVLSFGYKFDATNSSPNLIPIGPLRFYNGAQSVFEELRQWQLAIDATRTWDGGCGVDTNWSCDANWSSDLEPGSGDIAAFDNTSDNNSTVDATHGGAVAGVDINSGYDGTITQSRSLTIGSSDYNQAAGTWNSGSQTMDINNGDFTLSAGIFSASTGTFTIERSFNHSGGTFTHNSGTVTFDNDGLDDSPIDCEATTFNRVVIDKSAGFFTTTVTIEAGCTIPLGDNADADTHSGTLTNNGTITVGTGTFFIDGDYVQNTGATLTMSGTAMDINDGGIDINGGVFPAGLTTLSIQGNFDNSGNVFPDNVTLTVDGNTSGEDTTFSNCNADFTQVIISQSGSFTLDVTISTGCTIPFGNSPTVQLNGDGVLTNSGTITVGTGTFTLNEANYVHGSSATLTMSGTVMDFNDGGLDLNGGTFPQNLTAVSIQGNFDNSGDVFPDGVTLTLDGNDSGQGTTFSNCNTNFTQVIISQSGTQAIGVTVGSGCTIPLGDSPTVTLNAVALTNNGTVTVGTGTFTINDGGYIQNNGATLTMTGNTMNINGDSFSSTTGSLVLAGGTFSSNITSILVERNVTITGTTLPSGIALTLDGTASDADTTLTCGSNSLGSLTINKTSSGGETTFANDCTITGNLTRTDGPILNPSAARAFTVEGNFSMSTSDTFGGANLTLTMGGSGTQTITQNAGTMSGVFRVDKSGGSASMSTAFTTGSTCTVVEGTFDINGGNLTCGSTFTVEDGGTLQLQGAESSTTPTLNTGSTVTYTGDGDSNADTYNLKDWSYKNLTIAPTDSGDTFGADNSLDNNLETYYKMDNAGSTVDDDSGNNRDGTATGTTVVSGTIDDARSFSSAASDHISVPSSLPSFSSGGFSVAMWVNPTTSTSWARFIDFGQGQSDDNILLTRQSTGSDLIFEVYNGGSTGGQVEYSSGITNGSWQHFVATVDTSGSVVLYKNGSQVQTGTTAVPQNVTRTSNFIGRSNWASDAYYNGLIDETRIYSRPLSPQEVAAIHAGTTDNSISSLTVASNFTLSSGIFNAPPTMNVAGNFAHSGGTFTHNSGTINLNGSSQQISGNTTFYNLTKNTSSTDTLTFETGSAQTVENTLDLQGEAGNLLSLRSSSPGTQWDIDPQATRTIEFLDVQDSNNTNATQIATAGFNITNSGNNDGWTFGIVTQSPDSPGSLGPAEMINGDTTTDTSPTLSFVITDPDSDEQVQYRIQIDDNADFSSPTVDYTSTLGSQGPVSFTLGQSGTYAQAPVGNLMPDGEYYWRVKAIDENGVDSAFVHASSSIAFRIATVTPTPTPTSTPTLTPTPTPIAEEVVEEEPVGEPSESEEPSSEGESEEATESASLVEELVEVIEEDIPGALEGLLETVNSLVSNTSEILASAFPEGITEALSGGLTEIRESDASPIVENSAQAVVVGTGLAVYAPVIVREIYSGAVLLTFRELPILVIRYFLVLLELLHLRRRPKPWGVVYDSITKQPIDPAIVYLTKPGTKEGDEETRITDFTGRFGFLVGKGKHLLNVVKTDYVFPSKILAGKSVDGERTNLYFGEELAFQNSDLVSVNIPMDQVTFNWNQANKPVQYRAEWFIFKRLTFKIASLLTLGAALIAYVINPTALNLSLILVYLGLTVVHKVFVKSKKWGVVHDSKTGKVMPLVRIQGIRADGVSDGFCVTDEVGRYYLILDEGEHYLQVEKEKANGEYEVLKKVGPFRIKKNSTVLNPDIQV